jgi:3-oxoacyl-(acyl-carrier-protein) synthase
VEPIAIVGRGCVLPGALDVDTYWTNLAASRISLGPVPHGRWRLPPAAVLGDGADRAWTDIGGYLHGFAEVFDPTGQGMDAELLIGLDPVFQWVVHVARQALREAGWDGPHPRAGLVLGNLSFPSAGMAAYAEQVWWRATGRRTRSAEPVLFRVAGAPDRPPRWVWGGARSPWTLPARRRCMRSNLPVTGCTTALPI